MVKLSFEGKHKIFKFFIWHFFTSHIFIFYFYLFYSKLIHISNYIIGIKLGENICSQFYLRIILFFFFLLFLTCKTFFFCFAVDTYFYFISFFYSYSHFFFCVTFLHIFSIEMDIFFFLQLLCVVCLSVFFSLPRSPFTS